MTSHLTYTAQLLHEPKTKVSITFEDKGEVEPGVWVSEWRLDGGTPEQVRTVPAQADPRDMRRGLENYRYEEDMDLLHKWDIDIETMDEGR